MRNDPGMNSAASEQESAEPTQLDAQHLGEVVVDFRPDQGIIRRHPRWFALKRNLPC
jgi:hypothetical protein